MADAPQQEATFEQKLAEAQAKADENLNGWKRAAADYANLKKETEKQKEEIAKYAAAGLVARLLPAVDHFAKAMAQKPGEKDEAKKWIEGVEHVKREFDTVLAEAGLAPIAETGVPFDPAFHEAMMSERGGKSGDVLKVLEPGYKMHDRVLRAAKVVVAE